MSAKDIQEKIFDEWFHKHFGEVGDEPADRAFREAVRFSYIAGGNAAILAVLEFLNEEGN